MSHRRTSLSAHLYGLVPADITSSDTGDHRGLDLSIARGVVIVSGDTRFTGDVEASDYSGYGTLAQQAEAMRKLAAEAVKVAEELERRIAAAAAPERVATPAEKADDAARMERARQAAAAADPSPLPPLPAPGERPRQGTTKGGGVVWANADHHDDPPTTAEQDKAAFENAGHCGSPA